MVIKKAAKWVKRHKQIAYLGFVWLNFAVVKTFSNFALPEEVHPFLFVLIGLIYLGVILVVPIIVVERICRYADRIRSDEEE